MHQRGLSTKEEEELYKLKDNDGRKKLGYEQSIGSWMITKHWRKKDFFSHCADYMKECKFTICIQMREHRWHSDSWYPKQQGVWGIPVLSSPNTGDSASLAQEIPVHQETLDYLVYFTVCIKFFFFCRDLSWTCAHPYNSSYPFTSKLFLAETISLYVWI